MNVLFIIMSMNSFIFNYCILFSLTMTVLLLKNPENTTKKCDTMETYHHLDVNVL